MMYYVLAGLQPEGIMALTRPLTSIYGPNSAVFSFFLICVFSFFFFADTQLQSDRNSHRSKHTHLYIKCESHSPAAVHRRLEVTCAWTQPILTKLHSFIQQS